jgi:Protein of unknown function (DUF1185).
MMELKIFGEHFLLIRHFLKQPLWQTWHTNDTLHNEGFVTGRGTGPRGVWGNEGAREGGVAGWGVNPWNGQGFVEDLKPVILDLAPKLGDILVPELIKEIGSPDKILAYGKAGIVGLNGEIEHASAFIHTLRFGNKFKDAVGGTSYLSFTNTRGPAGSKISIPMMPKTDSGLRPY